MMTVAVVWKILTGYGEQYIAVVILQNRSGKSTKNHKLLVINLTLSSIQQQSPGNPIVNIVGSARQCFRLISTLSYSRRLQKEKVEQSNCSYHSLCHDFQYCRHY